MPSAVWSLGPSTAKGVEITLGLDVFARVEITSKAMPGIHDAAAAREGGREGALV